MFTTRLEQQNNQMRADAYKLAIDMETIANNWIFEE
jgi:hypothetical protein